MSAANPQNLEVSLAGEVDQIKGKRILPASLAPGSEFAKKKGRKAKKVGMENRLPSANRDGWAEFASNMISEEDIRAFNNDLRNKKMSMKDKSEAVEDARRIWNFGKKVGLSGNDSSIIDGILGMETQVSDREILGKENSNSVI